MNHMVGFYNNQQWVSFRFVCLTFWEIFMFMDGCVDVRFIRVIGDVRFAIGEALT